MRVEITNQLTLHDLRTSSLITSDYQMEEKVVRIESILCETIYLQYKGAKADVRDVIIVRLIDLQLL